MKKTYITKMPNKTGAFLKASTVISENGGNIVRVSYNKAVDVHTLFIDVCATKVQLEEISRQLKMLGYLPNAKNDNKVILIVLTLSDVPGAVKPVLEILNLYDINISYMSSQENGTGIQHFKMGLLIEKPEIIKEILDKLSKICAVKILDYSITEKLLDSTVFYIEFANEIRRILNLTQKQSNELIINSNKIMQILDERNEAPIKTFDFIRKFAEQIAERKGANFLPRITERQLSPKVKATLIEPPCGSNIYVLQADDEYLFVDSGFACYKAEMLALIEKLFPDCKLSQQKLLLTHADTDHSGLANEFAEVYVNKSCYENFEREIQGKENFREENPYHAPYCKISAIITGYNPPSLKKLKIIGEKKDNEPISFIGTLDFADLHFEIYEGNGGHIRGENLIVLKEYKIIFTGDTYVNVNGFTDEQSAFNLLAPYLMSGVNVDSDKAKYLREYVMKNYQGYSLFPGHGLWK